MSDGDDEQTVQVPELPVVHVSEAGDPHRVTIFVRDDGLTLLVCQVDGDAWALPPATPVRAEQDGGPSFAGRLLTGALMGVRRGDADSEDASSNVGESVAEAEHRSFLDRLRSSGLIQPGRLDDFGDR